LSFRGQAASAAARGLARTLGLHFKRPVLSPSLASLAGTRRFTSVVLLAATCGCAVDSRPTDAFNRVVDPSIAIQPGQLRSCDSTQFDHPPSIRVAAIPPYPEGRRRENQEDFVTAVFDVSTEGRVENLILSSRSSDNPDSVWFRRHAELAMRKWQMTPALKDAVPVVARCTFYFSFRLKP